MVRVKRVGQISSYAIVQLANVSKFTIMSVPGFQADFYNIYININEYNIIF